MIDKLNVGQVCSVKSFFNAKNIWYEYKKSRKFLGFELRKEGFYYTMTLGSHIYRTIEEIERDKRYICKNEKVYYKPHLEIKMSNQNTHDKYFETEAELLEFMKTDVMKSVNWIDRN